jgi:hypothetical protein
MKRQIRREPSSKLGEISWIAPVITAMVMQNA